MTQFAMTFLGKTSPSRYQSLSCRAKGIPIMNFWYITWAIRDGVDREWGNGGIRTLCFLEMAIGIVCPIRTAYRAFCYLLYNLPYFQFCRFKLDLCPDDPLSNDFEFPAAFAAGLPFRNHIFFDFCLQAGKHFSPDTWFAWCPGIRLNLNLFAPHEAVPPAFALLQKKKAPRPASLLP